MFTEIHKRTWNGAKTTFNDITNHGRWIFRGQAKSIWNLCTSIEKLLTNRKAPTSIEIDIFNEFYARAHHFLDHNQVPKNYFDWFALMQHHGAPTRLQDWTFSPYIASYFAFENAVEDSDYSVVYAINLEYLYKKSQIYLLDRNNINEIENNNKYIVDDSNFNLALKNTENIVFPMMPVKYNERLSIQQGLFLVPGNINIPFIDNLKPVFDQNSNFAYKILIPTVIREEVIKDLYMMNITATTLFPGIDGFSRTLKDIRIFKT